MTTEKGKEEAEEAVKPKAKRLKIHTILGTKGGVGKSTIATHLADWLKDRGYKILCYDLDDENATFNRFVPEARKLDTHDTEQTDELVFDAEKYVGDYDAMVLDLRAGAGNEMLNWFADVPFAELKEQGIDFVGWGCITSDPDSSDSVTNWLEVLASEIDSVIIVKNLKDGLFEDQQFRGEKARIIVEPVDHKLMARMNEKNCSLTKVLSLPKGNKGLTDTMMRTRVLRLRENLFAQFDTLKAILT